MSDTTIDQTTTAAESCCGPSAKPSTGPMGRVRQFVETYPAWLFLGASFIGLAIYDLAQAQASVIFVGDALLSISIFFALAVGAAAFGKATGADGMIARVFTGQLTLMIALAALFGGLSPFCSCGVIPIIAALLSMGVPLPAVMAFWLASPLMDPTMFMLTMGTLGLEFAIAKTIIAVGLGLFGGYATWALQANGWLSNPLRPEVGDGGCGGSAARGGKTVEWRFWQDQKRTDVFRREALATTLFLGKWLVIAFFLESIMLAYVPADAVATVLGNDSLFAIPLAVLVGVPAYLNGYAALPLVGGMIDLGVSPGAGMAFLVAGGVTSIPAAIAVFALVKKPVFLLYVAFALVGGMTAGIGFQFIV